MQRGGAIAQLQAFAAGQFSLADFYALHQNAVGAVQIFEYKSVAIALEFGVAARDARVIGQNYIARFIASDQCFGFGDVEAPSLQRAVEDF